MKVVCASHFLGQWELKKGHLSVSSLIYSMFRMKSKQKYVKNDSKKKVTSKYNSAAVNGLSHSSGDRCSPEEFSILASEQNAFSLKILEAFFIKKLKPTLNRKDISFVTSLHPSLLTSERRPLTIVHRATFFLLVATRHSPALQCMSPDDEACPLWNVAFHFVFFL